jgi:hypothetical protein
MYLMYIYLGLARTIYIYGVYTVYFGRDITEYTVIYGVYIRFWPTLHTFYVHIFSMTACSVEFGGKAHSGTIQIMTRVGQNRIYTPYMTVCMVISLPKTPYVHRAYL